ncbi:MAG: hypothetical protein FD153_1563 [Rhodospirillaceae bacterium]|nr:MAG: hypothetical protein FD153_1563 [Rhodospirillaceae bacterium]
MPFRGRREFFRGRGPLGGDSGKGGACGLSVWNGKPSPVMGEGLAVGTYTFTRLSYTRYKAVVPGCDCPGKRDLPGDVVSARRAV